MKKKALFYQTWKKHHKLELKWQKILTKNTFQYDGTFNTKLKSLKFLNGARIKGSCKIFLKSQKNPSKWISFVGLHQNKEYFHVPHGYLTIKYPDGDKYEGYWKNGSYYSHGKYFNHKSGTYFGTWDKGQMNGWGTYYFLNDHKYIGEFKNHNLHGLGTYITKNKVFRGYFKKGKFIKKLDDNYKIQKEDEDHIY